MQDNRSSGLFGLLAGLSKHLIVLIPLALLAGLVTGVIVDLSSLKVLVLPLTMLMVYPMLVPFRIEQILERGDWKAVGFAMGLDLFALPLIAWGLANLFFGGQPGLYVGMVLAGLFPTSGMTVSWTGFAKGNVGAAVKMTVVGLIVASLAAPLYLSVLAGKVVAVNMMEVVQTVIMVIGVPLLAGQLTRWFFMKRLGKQGFQQRIAPIMPGISTLGVVAIVFLAIGLKARMIVEQPVLVLQILVPLIIFYLVNFVISTWIGKALLPRGDAIALVYGTVMRNLSIALGIAIASFGPEAALVLATAYVVQVQGAAWYVKLTGRLFGPAEVSSVPVEAATAVAAQRG